MTKDVLVLIDILLSIEAIEDDNEREYVGLLYEKYSKKVKCLAKNVLKNVYDADDAVGITFLKIIKYRDKFMDIPENILIGRINLITRCACFDMMNKKNNNLYVSITDMLTDDEGNSSDYDIPDNIDILQELINSEVINKLHIAINELPSPAKEIVMMRYFEETSLVEIADILGMNDSTVRTILERSLKKMRKVLSKYYGEK